MNLDEKIEKLIIKHWEKVCKKISAIEEGKPNYWVKSHHYYLNPPVIEEETLSDNKRGEIQYYKTIRDVLRRLMNGEEGIPYDYHFNGAPEEIRNLLDKS